MKTKEKNLNLTKKFIPADLAHGLELWMKITSAIQNEIEELG